VTKPPPRAPIADIRARVELLDRRVQSLHGKVGSHVAQLRQARNELKYLHGLLIEAGIETTATAGTPNQVSADGRRQGAS
jgi:hypothetical protein